MIFKNSKLYDVLKYLALVVFDALGFAYSELADVWGLPYGVQIYKTCTIVSIFVGTVIGISSHQYNKIRKEFENEKVTNHEVIEEE